MVAGSLIAGAGNKQMMFVCVLSHTHKVYSAAVQAAADVGQLCEDVGRLFLLDMLLGEPRLRQSLSAQPGLLPSACLSAQLGLLPSACFAHPVCCCESPPSGGCWHRFMLTGVVACGVVWYGVVWCGVVW